MSFSRQAVNTEEAPPPRPFYNQAVVANGFVFCSGQLPKGSTGKIVSGTVQDPGSSLEKMVEFAWMNSCVAVKSIPEYTDVEMKCVALL
ncbi:hypothetical protein N7481_009500 [Penicillium waksmanii]|uniref:uncharacterized protein n=1 Tax=Penicillium waksmanii TaxID=69791 RepID=UPI0025491CE9|nr:uncharacterized protein N7481_009500 [Penicillium waksmanii]KAJ5975793.1 hypothetical protein N7481_009500 [Penicillium waksmanii]